MDNKTVYIEWCKYQSRKGLPMPAYSVEAYTQAVIDTWKAVLDKEAKIVVKKLLVGVIKEDFCDQDYLRDRDLVVPLYEGETETDAIRLWMEEHKHWIRADEKKYVNVIREVGLNEYAGSMLYR